MFFRKRFYHGKDRKSRSSKEIPAPVERKNTRFFPFSQIGKVVETPRLKILAGDNSVIVDADLADLKRIWQKPFDLGGEYAE